MSRRVRRLLGVMVLTLPSVAGAEPMLTPIPDPVAPQAQAGEAAPRTEPVSLDWTGLRALVLERSPVLQAQRLQIDAAAAAVTTARALPNPELQYISGRQQALLAGATAGATQTYAATWKVENPFARSARIDGARAGQDAAQLAYQSAVNDTLAEAKRRLFELVLRREEIKLAAETLEGLEQIRRRIEVRVNTGEAPRFELVKADTEVLNARQKLSGAKARAERARVSLEILTGGALPQHFVAQARLDESVGVPAPKLDDEIRLCNLELMRLAADSERAQASVRSERAQLLPGIQLYASRQDQPDMRTNQAGVAISVPLFDWRGGPIGQAKAEAARIRTLLDGRRQELSQLGAAAAQEYQLAAQQVATLETGVVREAQNAVRISETAYRFGAHPLLDVLDAQRVLRTARAELLEARYQLQVAAIELERLRGGFVSQCRPGNPDGEK